MKWIVVATAALLVARRRLLVVRVVGDSMRPWAQDGDRVLARRGLRGLRPGAVVVGRPPGFPDGTFFVKRATELRPDGRVWVQGDGAASADSRSWGPVAREALVGVVVARLRPRDA